VRSAGIRHASGPREAGESMRNRRTAVLGSDGDQVTPTPVPIPSTASSKTPEPALAVIESSQPFATIVYLDGRR